MDRGKLILTMLGILPAQGPSDLSDLSSAVTADQIRACLSSSLADSGLARVHISRLRRWVVSKLQGVTRDSPEDVGKDFMRVLRGDFGANLESIGDVTYLKGGFYCSSPSAAIPTAERTAILVGGYPSLAYSGLGESLHIGPVGRTIVGLLPEEISGHGIRTISLAQYCDSDAAAANPAEFLSGLSESGSTILAPPSERLAYCGDAGTERGFNFAPRGRTAQVGAGLVQLWRSPKGSGFEYFLSVTSSGVTRFVDLEGEDWRKVALAIDTVTRHEREVMLARTPECVFLEMDFGLPRSDLRMLYAMGASWRGIQSGRARYVIPLESESTLRSVLTRSWLRVRGQ
jgi:hypothetical protein